MNIVSLYGSILAVVLLHAPSVRAPYGPHPAHESNIELCRLVWQDRPEQQERCLIARRDLVEALERNPYARAKVRASCREAMRTKGRDPCHESILRAASQLSHQYNFLQAVIADSVMWRDPHRESDARVDLDRLAWCDDKYMRDPESVDYYSVLACVAATFPRTDDGYGWGPRD